MVKKLEQTGDNIAEDKVPENLNSAETDTPDHIKLASTLVDHSLDSSPMPIRCFYTADNRVFIGVIIGETSDSFLVGGAVRFIMEKDGKISSQPLGSESVTRWMKSGILYITHAVARSKLYYYTFLLNNGRIYLPDYMTEECIKLMENFIETNKFDDNMSNPHPIDLKSEVRKIPGASEKSFTPFTVSEKIH